MPSFAVAKQVFTELVSSRDSYRVPEPDLIMDNPDNVRAFHEAGREEGVMAPVYLFHAAQVSSVIRPGDTVLDLGCGPANQLGLVARLNPDVKFIGLDLSAEMLTMAAENLRNRGIKNVELKECDITDLNIFKPESVDAVMSTVVLHHLPDQSALFRCFSEVSRVLKPDGGLYLIDFGHLKTKAAIQYFAYQYENRQPPLFTLDYLHSLQAAFDLAIWQEGFNSFLKNKGNLFSTFLVPYMVAIKSGNRRELPENVRAGLLKQLELMPDYHRTDIKDLITFFRLGGLKTSGIG